MDNHHGCWLLYWIYIPIPGSPVRTRVQHLSSPLLQHVHLILQGYGISLMLTDKSSLHKEIKSYLLQELWIHHTAGWLHLIQYHRLHQRQHPETSAHCTRYFPSRNHRSIRSAHRKGSSSWYLFWLTCHEHRYNRHGKPESLLLSWKTSGIIPYLTG